MFSHELPLQYQAPLLAAEGMRESTSQSALSGLAAGAAVSTTKQLLLYPVDTVKVRNFRWMNAL